MTSANPVQHAIVEMIPGCEVTHTTTAEETTLDGRGHLDSRVRFQIRRLGPDVQPSEAVVDGRELVWETQLVALHGCNLIILVHWQLRRRLEDCERICRLEEGAPIAYQLRLIFWVVVHPRASHAVEHIRALHVCLL